MSADQVPGPLASPEPDTSRSPESVAQEAKSRWSNHRALAARYHVEAAKLHHFQQMAELTKADQAAGVPPRYNEDAIKARLKTLEPYPTYIQDVIDNDAANAEEFVAQNLPELKAQA